MASETANATNRQWVLAQRPAGLPDDATFKLVTSPLTPLKEGELRVRVEHFSVDPGSRPGLSRDSYIPAHPLGAVMMSAGIGTVVETGHDQFAEGDLVSGALGWQDYATSIGKRLIKLDRRLLQAPLTETAAIGVLGIPGLTAYFALLKIAKVQAGQTVLISSASGTVGATAGQIATIHGARAIGLAGSQVKRDWLAGPARFAKTIDYKETPDLEASIRDACPEGIDIYLDNVGAYTLDAAINCMNKNGRIVISGQISEYNRPEPVGIRNTLEFINRRLRMDGFVVLDYAQEFGAAQAELAGWIHKGDLVYREEIIEGIENAPEAYRGLFTGESFGRRIIRV